MIDFRYHIVSIVAVFLALAIGLVIGSTTLRPTVARDLAHRTDQLGAKYKRASAERDQARDQVNKGEAFDGALLPYVLPGRLAGQSVVVVSAPGADGGARSRLTEALTTAGADVTGDVRIQDTLLDPDQDAFLRTLTARVAPAGVSLPDGTGAERAAALLAEALGSRPQSVPLPPPVAARVLAAFDDAHLISVSGDAPRAGSLAVLVVGPAPTDPEQVDIDAATLLAEFAHDLDKASVGAVVAGPTTATARGGVLGEARNDSSLRDVLSTVDGADLPSGVIATVVALADQAAGHAGRYGVGSNPPLPSPSPG